MNRCLIETSSEMNIVQNEWKAHVENGLKTMLCERRGSILSFDMIHFLDMCSNLWVGFGFGEEEPRPNPPFTIV